MSTTTNVRGKLKGRTAYSLGKTIKVAGPKGSVSKNAPSIVEGIKPQKRVLDEGLHILTPNELAAILIPTQEVVGGKIHGFERPITRPHVRRLQANYEKGKKTNPPLLSIYNGALWVVDGQHRILAAIAARFPLKVDVEKLDAEEMRERYGQQIFQKKINPSNLILSRTDDFSTYVQEAAVQKKENPWWSITSKASTSTKKLVPNQVYMAVKRYVGNTLAENLNRREDIVFDREYADELAMLIKAFGNKETNPLAFKPNAIRAITYAAILIIRRRDSQKKDIDRWADWMPTFHFHEYVGISNSKELAGILIRHWNKRLSSDRRVKLPDDIV